jgi:hypothetical protein
MNSGSGTTAGCWPGIGSCRARSSLTTWKTGCRQDIAALPHPDIPLGLEVVLVHPLAVASVPLSEGRGHRFCNTHQCSRTFAATSSRGIPVPVFSTNLHVQQCGNYGVTQQSGSGGLHPEEHRCDPRRTRGLAIPAIQQIGVIFLQWTL